MNCKVDADIDDDDIDDDDDPTDVVVEIHVVDENRKE